MFEQNVFRFLSMVGKWWTNRRTFRQTNHHSPWRYQRSLDARKENECTNVGNKLRGTIFKQGSTFTKKRYCKKVWANKNQQCERIYACFVVVLELRWTLSGMKINIPIPMEVRSPSVCPSVRPSHDSLVCPFTCFLNSRWQRRHLLPSAWQSTDRRIVLGLVVWKMP